ncbi:HEAT repeat domain-containing protein [Bacillus aquiflavi]|uniref:HEAT repeat domain-containing protein n=1 Tax=Bacillus aquiflavi TaxID=2672567 RepID=UPI001CA9FC74|nr:HEAT repeat domain-containing protein [Bacillus aquiflavi]UAC46985.1 HEAT repeat domain-containing protein [Bacillus aquiflavi]
MNDYKEYVCDLLYRMTINTDEEGREVKNSKEQVSWKAMREAERLDHSSLISVTAEMVRESQDAETRKNACFLLSQLAKNTGNMVAVRIMLDEFLLTTDMRTKSSMLGFFTYVPKIPDAEPFLALSKSQNNDIRQKAIQVLARCQPEHVKERLLELIRNSKNDCDKIYTIRTLSELRMGELLSEVLGHIISTNAKVRSLVIRFAGDFGNAAHIPLFIEALKNDRSTEVKYHAMKAIDRLGELTHIDTVLKRVKAIISRKQRGGGVFSKSELMYGISFLYRVASDHDEVKKLLYSLQTSKSDRLFEHEAEWLAQLVEKR